MSRCDPTYAGWTDATTGQSETYAWDAENRLVKVTQSPANKEYLIRYDGLNRAYEIEYKWQGVTQKVTRLIWSGLQIVEERDMSQPSLPLVKYYGQGESQFISGQYMPFLYLRDYLGSVAGTFLYTPSSTRRFEEFGSWTGTAAGTPGASKKTFAGMYQPEGLDITMAPYRWYSPKLRTWLSRDPMDNPTLALLPNFNGYGPQGAMPYPELAQGPNLYSYVGNNPVNLWDPYGLYGFMDFMYDASGFSAGVGDTLTLGITDQIREMNGWNDTVDKCSGAYGSGQLTGAGLGLSMAGAGIAANAPQIAAALTAATEAAELGGTYAIAAGYVAGQKVATTPGSMATIADFISNATGLGSGTTSTSAAGTAGTAVNATLFGRSTFGW